MTERPRITILGADFAGLETASGGWRSRSPWASARHEPARTRYTVQ